ncbi:MAG: protein-L-isoaspartate O-methyltransferase [Gammaproteobacteria bacterium]|nr:MAG: protein-L-isoaspartate O-methyltransferase [Gammaproteobacteria bacterium]
METERTKLIETLRNQGIQNQEVLDCIAKIPRHLYVDEPYRHQAYWNRPLPIDEGQTISQPYIVALMTEKLLSNHLEKVSNKKVLEIGTGSGYQTAVLARLYEKVYTVERIHTLMDRARRVNQSFDIENIIYNNADGWLGWPEQAPFDGIIVTATCGTVPNLLIDQLKVGANLIAPIGPKSSQILYRINKTENSYNQEALCAVSFVPMLEGLLLKP